MNIEAWLYNAIRYIGILAPIPTAYVIAVSLQKHLHWHVVMAVIAAVIIEVVGFGVVYMYAVFREYNQTKRKTDPEAPLKTVQGLVGIYLVSVLLLTIVLDIFPNLSLYAPGLFPLLSVVGMALTALRFDHHRRLETIEAEKKERQEKRKPLAPTTPEPATPLDTRGKLLAYWRKHPQGSHTEAGKSAKVSRQRAQQLYKDLETTGVVHRNGNGVEVKAT